MAEYRVTDDDLDQVVEEIHRAVDDLPDSLQAEAFGAGKLEATQQFERRLRELAEDTDE